MFESMYFTMLMTPTYERPIDSAEDVIDKGLAVIGFPGSESLVNIWMDSPSYFTRTLAEMTTVPKVIVSYNYHFNITIP